MKSTDYFPNCDEVYEVRFIECWVEKDKQVVSIMDSNPVVWGDCRYFPIGAVFVCMENEVHTFEGTRPHDGCVGIVFDEFFERICKALGVPEEFIVETPKDTIRVKKEESC